MSATHFTVVISGASYGIGPALAAACLKRRAKVVGHARAQGGSASSGVW